MKTLDQEKKKKIETEVPKYKKKKNSSKSKANTKAKHKHEYEECMLICKDYPHRAEYCKYCGKIYDIKFSEKERTDDNLFRILDSDEVLEKYKDLKRFEINDLFQKYVPMVNGEKNEFRYRIFTNYFSRISK